MAALLAVDEGEVREDRQPGLVQPYGDRSLHLIKEQCGLAMSARCTRNARAWARSQPQLGHRAKDLDLDSAGRNAGHRMGRDDALSIGREGRTLDLSAALHDDPEVGQVTTVGQSLGGRHEFVQLSHGMLRQDNVESPRGGRNRAVDQAQGMPVRNRL